jgi:hypothetical protein
MKCNEIVGFENEALRLSSFQYLAAMSVIEILRQLHPAPSRFATNRWDNQSMSARQVVIVGSVVGLLVSSAVLTLLWFGVAGVLVVGKTDLMYVFWPASVMLVGGWRSTVPGVMITASAVAINCLLYMAVAYSIRVVVRIIANRS